MKYNPKHQQHGECGERFITVGCSQYRHHEPLTEPKNLSVGWYCVETKVGEEEKAVLHLGNQNFEAYTPMTFTDQRTKLNNNLTEPLFRGYAFLKLDTEEGDWSVIRSTRGVKRLVRFGEQLPARVPVDLIIALKKTENELGLRDIKHEYEAGDQIEVINVRALEYATGIFAADMGGRVTILMNILGEETKLNLSRRNIKPIT